MNEPTHSSQHRDNLSRRHFIQTSTAGLIASAASLNLTQAEEIKQNKANQAIRWGFVGTGSIANAMAKVLKKAPHATLTASSSRTLSKAEGFAKTYKAEKAFDSWAKMFEWDGVDAVYVATPTFVKEEISIAAAKAGKHVLCEKPLPSLPALNNILAACRENNVAFMDGTHFSHHPRSIELEHNLDKLTGKRRSLHSVFQFNVKNQDNIRLSPTQEPMGALGDAGWYNMRAIVDYLNPHANIKKVSASLRRDEKTNAVIGCTGIIIFDEKSTATFLCALDAGASKCFTEIDGNKGSIEIPKFVQHDRDNSASYIHNSRENKAKLKNVKVSAPQPDAAIMFADFAQQIHDSKFREKWALKSKKTQTLLDAVWESALSNEGKII